MEKTYKERMGNSQKTIPHYMNPITSEEPGDRGLYFNGYCWEYNYLPEGIFPAARQGPKNKHILGPVRIWFDANYAECWCSMRSECDTKDGRGCKSR